MKVENAGQGNDRSSKEYSGEADLATILGKMKLDQLLGSDLELEAKGGADVYIAYEDSKEHVPVPKEDELEVYRLMFFRYDEDAQQFKPEFATTLDIIPKQTLPGGGSFSNHLFFSHQENTYYFKRVLDERRETVL